jgi:hypothetical protein
MRTCSFEQVFVWGINVTEAELRSAFALPPKRNYNDRPANLHRPSGTTGVNTEWFVSLTDTRESRGAATELEDTHRLS